MLSTKWGIRLSSTRINEKSNEILEMQAVMKTLDCRDCVVTADAMNVQKATAYAIVKESYGDYYLALKGNQKTVYQETDRLRKKNNCQKRTNETHIEEWYYLCNIKTIAELFATVVRRHWHIENCQHWTLDVVFKEDKLRSKEKNTIHSLGLL